MKSLTKEQEAIVNHPIGEHAKILAVAGSGKTSTLVHRIKYLVSDKQVNPTYIQVLMFNRLARKQFNERMESEEIQLKPKVDTFHSYSYSFIQNLIASGKFPGNWDFWIDDKEEKSRITLKKVIESLEKAHKIPVNSVDIEEAYQAIQLWKGSLIPPSRAGYRGNVHMPRVYEAYEQERISLHALTYDDFIPIVVGYLEKNQELLQQYAGKLQHLIVDEYQDINYGQQRLIELLASNKADVIIVGDDDQTIFEWRGARPDYIIRKFETIFNNKPIINYTLSHSFRFGAVIAQCASNSISFNTNRVEKSLVSHDIKKPANIFLFEQSDTDKALTDQILILLQNKDAHPSKIIVLCRMFSQLSGIESEFITRKIPYRIMGQRPFFERREIKVLLDYVRLAIVYHDQITEKIKNWFLNVANTPNRMLARKNLEQLMSNALIKKRTLAQALEFFVEDPVSPLNNKQKERVLELMSALENANKIVRLPAKKSTVVLLLELISSINYDAYFKNYYGKGEESVDRILSIRNFIEFAQKIQLPPVEFLAHIEKLDTTRGKPEDEQIVMTTIFRTKGLEYDYVIIPNCNEGYMPCLYATDIRVFDTKEKISEPDQSEIIENERRLFYVAITRAKEAVYIGTKIISEDPQSQKPSRFIDEIQYEPTDKVMTALQQTANGEKDAKQNLLSLITKFGGIKNLKKNLLDYYLKELGDQSLIEKAESVISSSKEIPFSYRFAYSSETENRSRKEKRWWDKFDEKRWWYEFDENSIEHTIPEPENNNGETQPEIDINDTVKLINHEPINPFSKSEIKDAPSGIKSKDVFFHSSENNPEQRLKSFKEFFLSFIKTHQLEVEKIESLSWQERYHLIHQSGAYAIINITYNGKGDFKTPMIMKAEPSEFKENLAQIFLSKNPMKEFLFASNKWRERPYTLLSEQLNLEKITIHAIVQNNYHDILKLSQNKDELEVDFYYDSHGFFSKIIPKFYSSLKLWESFKKAIHSIGGNRGHQ